MKCDRRLLSDYLDGDLPGDLDRDVAEHLITCQDCRRVVQQYRDLGRELRLQPSQPVPPAIAARLRVRLAAPRPSPLAALFAGFASRPLLPALGLVATLFLVVSVLAFQQQQMARPAFVAAYPPNGATDVVLDEEILVEFDRPIDSNLTDWTVSVDPPVSVSAEVIGNKIVLRPTEPLQPDTTYVVHFEPKKPASGVAAIGPQQASVTLNFSTGNALAAARPTATPTPKKVSPTVVPAATPTTPTVAAPTSTPAGQRPTPAGQQPSPIASVAPRISSATSPEVCLADSTPGATSLLRIPPETDRRLGCAVKRAATTTVAEQSFTGGIVLVGVDQVYVLSSGLGRVEPRWVSYDTRAPSKATGSSGTGTPVGTPGTASAAAGATPAATPTATPTLTPTATSSRTPTPLATLSVTPAPITPSASPPPIGKETRRFLADQPDLAATLGVPTGPELNRPTVVQEYAGGLVIAVRGEVGYLLFEDGHWERVAAMPTLPEPARETPTALTPIAPTPVAPSAGNATPTPSAAAPSPTVTPSGTPGLKSLP